jgi:hypothetical protein
VDAPPLDAEVPAAAEPDDEPEVEVLEMLAELTEVVVTAVEAVEAEGLVEVALVVLAPEGNVPTTVVRKQPLARRTRMQPRRRGTFATVITA